MTVTRWGILGCGSIAATFATGLTSLTDARLIAVGSRSAEKAEAFGAKHGAPNRHTGYEALVNDPEVDVIYVATPHPMHAADSLLCLEAGKPVLCEKPFTLNAGEARIVVQASRSHNLFLMEAMWSRFLPSLTRVRELVQSGAIGEPRMLQADFGFRAGFNPEGRLFNPSLGGGALLDVGCYCVSLASMIFGAPDVVTGLADLGETGVDEQAAMVLLYPGGRIATLSTAIRTNTPHEALLAGTEGSIRIHSPWWKATELTVTTGGAKETISIPFEGNGFNYEAAEAMACLRAGLIESPIMPHDETITIMETMDKLRAQWGLIYPTE